MHVLYLNGLLGCVQLPVKPVQILGGELLHCDGQGPQADQGVVVNVLVGGINRTFRQILQTNRFYNLWQT